MNGYVAVDLGAESGRVMLGAFDGDRLSLEEVHRFANRPVALPSALHWDVLRIFADLTDGIAAAHRSAARQSGELASIGVDAWGVDFALLDRDGSLIGNPVHYRDRRTDGVAERLFARVPADEIYAVTGIQHLPLNTLIQLAAVRGSAALESADALLMIPDLMNFWLTDQIANERTNASTTQLYDPVARSWATPLIERAGIPTGLFRSPLLDAGTAFAPVSAGVAATIGLPSSPSVALVGSHDTASAVVAVPATSEDTAYISSGTWSLVGIETPAPVLTSAARAANLTNEAGVGGTTRLLKNVMGLWLLQECRRAWARDGQDIGYDDLTVLAAAAPAFGPVIDPDDPALFAPGDMPSRIRLLCSTSGQAAPDDPGATVRCALESLALKYRWTIEAIEAVTKQSIGTIHIVGGGSRNRLLCQLTADATGRPTFAGPAEATAIGNVLTQAMAHGKVGSVAEIRDVVRRSFPIEHYDPSGDRDRWDEAFARLTQLTGAAAPRR